MSLHITPLQIFSSFIFYFGQKYPMKVPILILSSVLMKISQIPCVIFQTTRQFFFKFCMTLQCQKIFLRCTIYVKHYILCTKGTNRSANFLDFLVLGLKFTKFVSFLKQEIFKFSTTLQCHEAKLLCTFLAEILYTFDERSLSKYKFGEISPEHLEVWNFPLWWVPFVKIIQNFS